MMAIGAFLTAAIGPLAKRAAAALGFGVVSYVGVDLALGQLLGTARDAWAGSLGADVAAYVAMAGLNTGLSILAGALAGRVALIATKRMMLL